jgi:hypothetical protein
MELILSAYVAWRAGIYDIFIPSRFLASVDCSSIPALEFSRNQEWNRVRHDPKNFNFQIRS